MTLGSILGWVPRLVPDLPADVAEFLKLAGSLLGFVGI